MLSFVFECYGLERLKNKLPAQDQLVCYPCPIKRLSFSNSFYMVRPTVTISDNYVTFQRKASLIAAPTLAAVCIEVNL